MAKHLLTPWRDTIERFDCLLSSCIFVCLISGAVAKQCVEPFTPTKPRRLTVENRLAVCHSFEMLLTFTNKATCGGS